MQKILTKKEQDKKTKQKQLIIGLVLILLMVFSTLGYALNDKSKENNNENKVQYNGVNFIKQGDFWEFHISSYQFLTMYNPEEVKDISFLNILTLQSYTNKPLYFVGENNDVIFELSKNLNGFVQRMQKACLSEEECSDENLPIKNCSEDNIIIIKEPLDDKETIYEEDNCAFIISNSSNQLKYADAFLFKILGL